MSEQDQVDERDVLRIVIDNLHRLSDEARIRILKATATFFGLDSLNVLSRPLTTKVVSSREIEGEPNFSNRSAPSPKDFLLQKEPKTEVERVTCLAYYLTYYRDTPHFKTIDISKLNTEAAQLKFSNAAYTVSNAVRAGLLAPAEKGNKQISAQGERLVDALPNREAVKAVLLNMRRRRNRKRTRKGQTQQPSNHEVGDNVS
jgi:hypothetical protein